MVSDPIRDELHRLNKEFSKLLGMSDAHSVEKTTSERLAKFGLTLDEAKAWLEQEPDYKPIRRNFTKDKPDEDLTEPKGETDKKKKEKQK